MQKFRSHIVGILIVACSLIPPMDFEIAAPIKIWPWMVLVAGFLGFYLFFLKVAWPVKGLAVLGFLNCFYSAAPFVSFTSYFALISCCYFYFLCSKVQDYRPIFRMLQCLAIFNLFMLLMQVLKNDVLLNFGLNKTLCFGVTGQHMQTSSFSVILAATLLPFSRPNLAVPFLVSAICNSVGGFMSAGAGLLSFAALGKSKNFLISILAILLTIFLLWGTWSSKFTQNLDSKNGRLVVWKNSLELANKRPWKGWGIATYKYLYPALKPSPYSIKWSMAHNCWLQILFECGRIGFLIVVGYFFYLFIKLLKLTRRQIFRDQAVICLAGLTMIAVNMTVHFPTRMLSTVLLIIFFISYCQKVVNDGSIKSSGCQPCVK